MDVGGLKWGIDNLALLIRGARQLLTLRGSSSPRRGSEMAELAIIEDGSLLISDGLIREVGPSRRIENLAVAREAHEIDATGHVVMPAFVDCRANLFDAARRGRPGLTPARLELEARELLRHFIRHGTLTAGVHTADARELKLLAPLSANLMDLLALEAPLAEAAAVGGMTGTGRVREAVARSARYCEDPREELDLLAGSTTTALLRPQAPYLRHLINMGAAIALTSGFGETARGVFSMPMVMADACSQLEPEEAVVASTINAAHVLGIPRLVGSLEVGKQADVLLLNIRDYRDLFRYAGANLVSKAIKRGRLVYQQGAVEWPDD